MNHPAAPPDGKYRILIVEDEMDIARLLLAGLTAAGFECLHAPNGKSGLESFAATNPHLVLLDLMMPDIHGRDVCAKIRETSTVLIVLMTADNSDMEQMQGFGVGADDYVAKPFNPKLLVARLAAHLRRVYRYDVPEDPNAAAFDAEEEEVVVPPGWATCESCNYMGPRQKFEKHGASGRVERMCPNCRQSDFIVFSL